MIDLHLHSTASDGTESPAELIRSAAAAGASAVALTDHDTLGGLPEAAQAAASLGVGFLPGIEIGAGIDRDVHILGYGLGQESAGMNALLERMKASRLDRLEEMLRKLRALGISISREEVLDKARGESVGRPHVGRILVERGCAPDLHTAFAKYLAEGAVAFVSREKFSCGRVIEAIRACGGVAVLAHPAKLSMEPGQLGQYVDALREMGLEGVECYHPSHTPAVAASLRRMAGRRGMLVTGGSDRHGPAARIGLGLEAWTDADSCYLQLTSALPTMW